MPSKKKVIYHFSQTLKFFKIDLRFEASDTYIYINILFLSEFLRVVEISHRGLKPAA